MVRGSRCQIIYSQGGQNVRIVRIDFFNPKIVRMVRIVRVCFQIVRIVRIFFLENTPFFLNFHSLQQIFHEN